jgi:peptide deformylase
MAKLEIIKYPDPILRKKTDPVDLHEPGLAQFVEDMFEAMYAAEGVGLAANQVGFNRRVVVIDTSSGEDPKARLVLINPVLLTAIGHVEEEEGCLSFPKIRAITSRGSSAKVRAQNLNGEFFEIESDGLLGKALQHELDHLDGKVFVDRISLAQKALISGRLKELKAEYKGAASKTGRAAARRAKA